MATIIEKAIWDSQNSAWLLLVAAAGRDRLSAALARYSDQEQRAAQADAIEPDGDQGEPKED